MAIHPIFNDCHFFFSNTTFYCSGSGCSANGNDMIVFVETRKDLFLEINQRKDHVQTMDGYYAFYMLITRMK
ncbi:Uncharacterised protein [Mycobacterium tuberculosis]|nr:Uncharacterised protein [Mycobacterium tuberculosis]